MSSSTTLDILAVCGEAAPSGPLFVYQTAAHSRYAARRAFNQGYEGLPASDPWLMLNQAVANAPTALRQLTEGWGCHPGCWHQTTQHNASGSQPYRALISVRYVRRGRVIMDYQHAAVSAQAVTTLHEHLRPYKGREGAEARTAKAKLEAELTETYRLALDFEAHAQRALVATNTDSDQSVLDRLGAWRREVWACNARLDEGLALPA